MAYKGYFIDLARGNHCDRTSKNSGGSKRQWNTAESLKLRRMQPGPELAALFGVYVPSEAEKAELVHQEHLALQREEMAKRAKPKGVTK